MTYQALAYQILSYQVFHFNINFHSHSGIFIKHLQFVLFSVHKQLANKTKKSVIFFYTCAFLFFFIITFLKFTYEQMGQLNFVCSTRFILRSQLHRAVTEPVWNRVFDDTINNIFD